MHLRQLVAHPEEERLHRRIEAARGHLVVVRRHVTASTVAAVSRCGRKTRPLPGQLFGQVRHS